MSIDVVPTSDTGILAGFLALTRDPMAQPTDAELETLRSDPVAGRALHCWGRDGDAAVLALSDEEIETRLGDSAAEPVPGMHPVGAAWIRRPETADPEWIARDCATLAVAVLPEFTRRGVGRGLVGAALSLARLSGFSAVGLALPRALESEGFFETLGFGEIGTLGESALLLRHL